MRSTFVLVVLASILASSSCVEGYVPISLGRCENFAVLSAAGTSFDGRITTVSSGDIGVSPGTAITGSYHLNTGSVMINTDVANGCRSDMTTAYNAAKAAFCPVFNYKVDLAGDTLFPGVYCSSSSMFLSASTVTLDGNNDPNAQWIFQTGSTFISAAATSFILINGAYERNVYWALGSAATLAHASSMVGNIFAQSAITFNSDSTIVGRAFAMTAVTFESGSTVTLPVPLPIPPYSKPAPTPGKSDMPAEKPIDLPTFSPSYVPTSSPTDVPSEAPVDMLNRNGWHNSWSPSDPGQGPGQSNQSTTSFNEVIRSTIREAHIQSI